MRHREAQVGYVGLEVVHEAGHRTIVFAAIIGHDAGGELAQLPGSAPGRPPARGPCTLAARSPCGGPDSAVAARGKQISIALMMPAAPSEVTSSGSFEAAPLHVLEERRHRLGVLLRARHHMQQHPPSTVKSQAARTGSRLAPGRNRSANLVLAQIALDEALIVLPQPLPEL